MLFPDVVLSWQADSWKRVRATTGTTFLLNTNRMDSIRQLPNGDCSLYYFDNPYDARDAGHFMVINSTLAMLIGNMDYAAGHNSFTVGIYPNNDSTKTPVDTEIANAYFAYGVAQVNHATRSWITYAEAGWDLKTVLVNNTLANILFQVL